MERFRGFYWSPANDQEADWAALRECRATGVVVPAHAITSDLLARAQDANLAVAADLTMFAGAALRDAFPDSAPINDSGAPMMADAWYLPVCPNHAGIRARHLEQLTLLLERHGAQLAGIWLDFIRYPMRWEVAQPRLAQVCFCDRCLNLFLREAERGYTPAQRATLTHGILAGRHGEWVEWKCNRIAGFVREIANLIRARQPGLRLGLFALPWRLTDYDGAIRAIVGQDLALLGRIVDIVSPMTYHRLCYRDLPWIAAVAREAAQRSGAAILPVVQSLDQPQPLAATKFSQALDLAGNVADAGVMIFELSSTARDPAKVAATRDAFARRG